MKITFKFFTEVLFLSIILCLVNTGIVNVLVSTLHSKPDEVTGYECGLYSTKGGRLKDRMYAIILFIRFLILHGVGGLILSYFDNLHGTNYGVVNIHSSLVNYRPRDPWITFISATYGITSFSPL